MPNHIHAIIWITEGTITVQTVGAPHDAWPDEIPPQFAASNPEPSLSSNYAAPVDHAVEPHSVRNNGAPCFPAALKRNSLGLIVRAFKSSAAKRINRLRRTPNAPVWQRNYYEHIIRDEEDLFRIRQYIIDNPAKWAEDADNPTNRRMYPSQTGFK